MSEEQKKVAVVAVVIVAVVVAIYSAYRVLTADNLQVGVQHAGFSKSMKQQEMERQSREDAAAKTGSPAPATEADLSGKIQRTGPSSKEGR